MRVNLEINYFWFDFVESSYNTWDWEGFEIKFMELWRNSVLNIKWVTCMFDYGS